MITLPGDVRQGDNWSGYSEDKNTGANESNLDSSMSFVEHQRIVVGARDLLTNMDFTDQQQQENLAKAALMILKDAYTTNDGGTVYISKGIHQSYSNPHIQLTVKKDQKIHLFHLDVSAHDVVKDISGKEYFHWRGACFSARIKNNAGFMDPNKFDSAWWPEGVVATPKRNRDRRDSISAPQLQKVNDKIAEENERRRLESEAATRRNEVLATIAKKLSLTPADKSQLAKFWRGEPANFKTSTNKPTSCTFDGSIFTHNNGQKLKI